MKRVINFEYYGFNSCGVFFFIVVKWEKVKKVDLEGFE